MIRLLGNCDSEVWLLSVLMRKYSDSPGVIVTSSPMSRQLCALFAKVIGATPAVLLTIFAIFLRIPALGGGHMVEGLHAPLTRVPEGGSDAMALDSMIIHPLHAPL